MVENKKNISRNTQDSANPKPNRTSKDEVSNKLKSLAKQNRSLDRRNALEYECGKPNMPSRSELKKQYEEEEEEQSHENRDVITLVRRKPNENNSSTSEITLTPKTIKRYADALLKVFDGHEAPLPVTPIKRFKKSDVQYIDNCTKRPRVSESKTCNVFKGDIYGISGKTNVFNIDEDNLETPGFNGMETSTLNAQANEIASKLLSTKYDPIKSGSDSDDTVVYDFNAPENRFSPQPSTSKDSEIIFKNEQRFNNVLKNRKGLDCVTDSVENVKDTAVDNKDGSFNIKIPINSEQVNTQLKSNAHVEGSWLNNKSSLNNDFDNDVEIIEQPCETIEINGNYLNTDEITKPYTYAKNKNNSDIVIEIADEICDKSKITNDLKETINKNNSTKVVKRHKRFVKPTVVAKIDLATINDEDFENKSRVDKYRLINTSLSVADKSIHKNVLNKQFGSRIEQKFILKTRKHPYPNSFTKVKDIMKRFFDKWDHIDLLQKNKRIRTLTRNEKMLPELILNISCHNVDSPCKSKSPEKVPVNSLRLPTCPICLEELRRESIGSTNCGHLFCMSCLFTALKNKSKKCPTCRKKLTGAGYHQIYM